MIEINRRHNRAVAPAVISNVTNTRDPMNKSRARCVELVSRAHFIRRVYTARVSGFRLVYGSIQSSDVVPAAISL